MTTTHPHPNPSSPSTQLTFGSIWNEAWRMYGKRFFQLTALYFVPILIVTVLPYIFFSNADPYADEFFIGQFSWPTAIIFLGQVAIFLLMLFLQYLAYAAFIRTIYQIDSTANLSLKEAFITALKRIWTYIFLNIRVFIYSLIWIFIPLFFLSIMAMTGLNILGSPESAGMRLEGEVMMGILIVIAVGIFIAGMIIVTMRLLRTIFAYPMIFSGEKITSKEALKSSIELSKGITWKIFGYYLLLGLIFFLAMLVYLILAGSLMFAVAPESLMELGKEETTTQGEFIIQLVTLPFIIITNCFSAVFAYAFMKKAREVKAVSF